MKIEEFVEKCSINTLKQTSFVNQRTVLSGLKYLNLVNNIYLIAGPLLEYYANVNHEFPSISICIERKWRIIR